MTGRRGTPKGRLAICAPLLVLGCELQEITIAEPEDVVIAEVLIQVQQAGPTTVSRVSAFLHRTIGGTNGSGEVPGADIRLRLPGGREIRFDETDVDECLTEDEFEGRPVTGSCYRADTQPQMVRPGDPVSVVIELADGGTLTGETVLAEGFELVTPVFAICKLEPDSTLELMWRSAPGAWAYVSETSIRGLPLVLAGRGIVLEEDPLNLVGLAVSASDTTIVFPSEFGLFERFDLDRELALLLQNGLPEGANADLVLAAADRNWVNWVRGGNFNPSGQVRIPSIRGDGTGVLGSVVRRPLKILTIGEAPPCR